MKKKYPVVLTGSQPQQLQELIAAGTAPARKLAHARVLLKADQGPGGPAWVDDAIAEAVKVSRPTVARIGKQYAEQDLGAALTRRTSRRVYERKLADKLVELEIADEVSYQTVRRVPRKMT